MDPSLVGSQMSSDASCGESSVCEGAGYNEAFGSGHESEDFSLSSGGGTSARSPDGNESCTGEDEVGKGREGEGVEGDMCTDGEGSDSDGDQGDGDEETGDNRPFILPED